MQSQVDEQPVIGFHEMGLDDRLVQAIARLRWSQPTLIQEKAIPLALEGKDLLARARTGSGKTAAFAVPCVQRILAAKRDAPAEASLRALVLAPSRELCRQLTGVFRALTACCSRHVRCVNVGTDQPPHEQRPALQHAPDILVGTPSRVLAHLQADSVHIGADHFQTLVIDEADLMVTFGHGDDVDAIVRRLPSVRQTLLFSATVSPHVKQLRRLLLHNPVVLRLHEPQLPPADQLAQYHVAVEEGDKFLLLYALFKLKLIHGKTIVFVNTVDRCYRVKLFLEQFGVPSCALNSHLPANCRSHIVDQFNSGAYDIIIASDERFLEPAATDADVPTAAADVAAATSSSKLSKTGGKESAEREAGAARGLDFQFVSNVINLDMPCDADAYVHRVGRTARGNCRGVALSLVSASEQPQLAAVRRRLAAVFGGGGGGGETEEEEDSVLLRPFNVRLEEMAGLRYRAQDALRAVTRRAVREARLKEIKQQMYQSRRLRAHFERHPRDLQLLRHDRALHTARVHKHMKHVPDYIVPRALRRRAAVEEQRQEMARKKAAKATQQNARADKHKRSGKQAATADDPLKTLEFSGLDEFR